MHRALLIDDEPPARSVLRTLLARHPEVTIVGEAGTLASARELLARSEYTVIFLDVQLRGGTGFELVPHVRPDAAIVFVTAHDEHALRAFEVNALDYLLKPVKPDRLATALARCTPGRPRSEAAPSTTPQRLEPSDTVYVRTDDGGRFIRLTAICALQSCENYSEIHLETGEKLLVRQTLKSWEDSLPSPPFARVHRQALANLAHLLRIQDDGGDGPLLHIRRLRTPLRASRREWADLRALLPTDNGEPFRVQGR